VPLPVDWRGTIAVGELQTGAVGPFVGASCPVAARCRRVTMAKDRRQGSISPSACRRASMRCSIGTASRL